MGFFAGIWAWLRSKSIFVLAAKTIVGVAAESIKDIAVAVVSEINQENISSSEKRALAIQRIKEAVAKEGRDVSAAAINLAIELAVSLVKEA